MQLRYEIDSHSFIKIPGSPIAYWGSKSVYSSFARGTRLDELCSPRVGLQTSDNEKFLRNWYEVSKTNINANCSSYANSLSSDCKFYFHNKGGSFRRWYGNISTVLNYQHNGEELRGRKNSAVIPNDIVFKPQISYSRLGGLPISARAYPTGMTFDSAAVCIFPNHDKELYVLALLNSFVVNLFSSMISPTINVQPGDIGKIPVIIEDQAMPSINILANACLDCEKEDWDSFETSWGFKKHPLI